MKTIEEAMLFIKQLIECNDAAGCGRCNDLRIAVKILEEHLASRDSRQGKPALNDLDGQTILVKFSVQKGKLKVHPEEFDFE